MTQKDLDKIILKTLTDQKRITKNGLVNNGLSTTAIYKVFGTMEDAKRYASKRFPKIQQEAYKTPLTKLSDTIRELLK